MIEQIVWTREINRPQKASSLLRLEGTDLFSCEVLSCVFKLDSNRVHCTIFSKYRPASLSLTFDFICLQCRFLCVIGFCVHFRHNIMGHSMSPYTARSLTLTRPHNGTLHEPIHRTIPHTDSPHKGKHEPTHRTLLCTHLHIMGRPMSPCTARSLAPTPHVMGHSMSAYTARSLIPIP